MLTGQMLDTGVVGYTPDMTFDTSEHDQSTPAPDDLELVQRFMNLHEHDPRTGTEIPASTAAVHAFLVDRGLLRKRERFADRDRERALRLADALRARVPGARPGGPSREQVALVDRAAQDAGLHPHFEPEGPVLVPSEQGIAGALGRLIAIAFLADLDGRWYQLKICGDRTCSSVFYDRSKNHSGRWCSMQACGNRNKVRAWRERQRATS
jgi:CGNR zinc finger/Putative stress-induced transcription regulator